MGGMTVLSCEDCARAAAREGLTAEEVRDQASQSLGMVQLALWMTITAHGLSASLQRWHAIIEATVRRFRPIVLTALAAILAMIPLSGSAFFGPMAVAIMGGLTVATALTLLFLPARYAAWFKVRPDEMRAG